MASSDLARGRHLYETRGCAECHGANGAGKAFIDSPEMRVKGSDISAGGPLRLYLASLPPRPSGHR
jgi:mono/diheme cytochrome c family protein